MFFDSKQKGFKVNMITVLGVRMDDITIIENKKMDLSNSMIIVAFPTVGLISSISGHYIIDSLKLEEIGSVVSRYFSPTAVIHKSKPSPPVRIFAGKKMCGPDDSCEQIAVVISEFMPPMELIKPLADKIIEWGKKKNCKMIVALEGMHTLSEAKNTKLKVYGIGSNQKIKKHLKNFKIDQIKEGMITGVSGVLLYEGELQNRDIMCLLAEAHEAYPDSRAAGNLIEKLDVMLPGIKIDPKPLYEQAEDIEKNIRKYMDQAKPTAPTLPPLPTTMYG
jgi:uncharacterized protein